MFLNIVKEDNKLKLYLKLLTFKLTSPILYINSTNIKNNYSGEFSIWYSDTEQIKIKKSHCL